MNSTRRGNSDKRASRFAVAKQRRHTCGQVHADKSFVCPDCAKYIKVIKTDRVFDKRKVAMRAVNILRKPQNYALRTCFAILCSCRDLRDEGESLSPGHKTELCLHGEADLWVGSYSCNFDSRMVVHFDANSDRQKNLGKDSILRQRQGS